MTEPDLSAAQQEAVRRMLASARHDEPMPDEVAGRLDDILAGLSAERLAAAGTDRPSGQPSGQPSDRPADLPTDRPAGGEVVGIDSARSRPDSRPRRWPAYLLSAAAVVAIGFGVTQMIPSDDTSDDGAGAADQSRVRPNSAPSAGDEKASARPGETLDEAPQSNSLAPEYAGKSLPLPDIAGLEPRRPGDSNGPSAAKRSQRNPHRLAQDCLPHDVPPSSEVRAASFRGKDAIVLYLPSSASERRVEVYLCGSDSDQPVRSLSLPPEE